MQRTAVWFGIVFAFSTCASMSPGVNAQPSRSIDQSSGVIDQVIVQIGGRYCEYHRDEVEGALRRYPAVQDVEFLNDHGTVLVRYQSDRVPPAQLAESVEQALASGIGCKAWVDRGGQQRARS